VEFGDFDLETKESPMTIDNMPLIELLAKAR
jgi:hypothetical protein